MKLKLFLSVLVAAFVISGCGTARNIVSKPADGTYKSSDISIVTKASAVNVPDEERRYFDKKLHEEVFKNFVQGSHLTLTYTFISFDEGSRLKRYISGGIGNWGEGTLLIQADFTNEKGENVGSVQTDAKIGSGLLGGSIDSALDKAAEKIAEYATSNFK